MFFIYGGVSNLYYYGKYPSLYGIGGEWSENILTNN